jgi:antirestriction protein
MTTTLAAKTSTGRQVWVGCLACYNAGRLVGDWVDAADAADYTPCTRTDWGSPHEEFWCFDHEGFDGWVTGEVSPVEATSVDATITAIEQDGYDPAAVAAWADHLGVKITEWDRPTADNFADAYAADADSLEDFVTEFVSEVGYNGVCPAAIEALGGAVDFGYIAHDWTCSGDVFTVNKPDGGVWIFWNR